MGLHNQGLARRPSSSRRGPTKWCAVLTAKVLAILLVAVYTPRDVETAGVRTATLRTATNQLLVQTVVNTTRHHHPKVQCSKKLQRSSDCSQSFNAKMKFLFLNCQSFNTARQNQNIL
ncbi:hypothetical protein DPMN_078371 [Dreissena polymorpha]|uniref:Uncharacterized protein n=1 Tax=Dreissena polymorpha TaxID=45954 RepID=A0A9D4BS35_DREPO|nr:hypothetical protein DPMN_078371 [Dreissena polymorpha]